LSPFFEKAIARTSDSEAMVRSWADRVAIASRKIATRMLRLFQHDVEVHRGARRALLIQSHGAHELAILSDAALLVVLVGIALEERIGREVNLSHQSLVSR